MQREWEKFEGKDMKLGRSQSTVDVVTDSETVSLSGIKPL